MRCLKTLSAFAVLTLFSFAVVSAQSVYIKGTDGDDNLVTHAISGEPPIAQDYEAAGTGATGPNGETLRADDPNDPVISVTRTYFPGHPYIDPEVKMKGRDGADEFLIRTYISGKPAIVARNADPDTGVIDWSGNGVAGENDNVHDHWVDYFGTVKIKDFDAGEGDTIRVQGHTVALNAIEVLGDDTLIVVQSQQGNGGGAHDEDILGYIIVEDAALTADDVTFTHTNDGLTETLDEFLALVAYYEVAAESLRGNQTRVNRLGNAEKEERRSKSKYTLNGLGSKVKSSSSSSSSRRSSSRRSRR